ncbi:Alpha/Beta hydrolase protein [Roridomyces roridus]|uniref:Alpha/Beta hydrolase protein n=1 Tax=Roridomyces roridus TaxID=1738132 RepID=A0AAD7BKD6_9AGAR|nr:Alpha/Beta hydrolase protein [Roridomyces roridus]
MALLSAVVLALASLAAAAPSLLPRQSITNLTQAQIDAFTPYEWYASAGYCSPATTLAWNCGANCDANPGFQPVASGGDGNAIQFWYVGVDKALGTVIVAHQGTDPSQILSVVTDGNVGFENLNSTLFPGLPSGIQAHSGFANEQAQTATQVLAAVQSALSSSGLKKVTIVGHSLGGAIGLLDSVYLPLHITGVTFSSIFFGLPRVGNLAFATFASTGNTITHINNKEDFVPIIPGVILGFHHPTGEIHINDNGSWNMCPGMDLNSTLCSTGDVPTFLQGNLANHNGPYNQVTMGC